MIVRFNYPMGTEGWTKDVEIDHIPRVGDSIRVDEETELTVHVVVWQIFRGFRYDDPFDVYVVVR